ncbi:MAG: hypothetical protein ACLP50_13885 [Solirubrobacteraceae bacterium]
MTETAEWAQQRGAQRFELIGAGQLGPMRLDLQFGQSLAPAVPR